MERMSLKLISCLLLTLVSYTEAKERKLTVFTVATERTDGYLRFVRSLDVFGFELVTLGLGQDWQERIFVLAKLQIFFIKIVQKVLIIS